MTSKTCKWVDTRVIFDYMRRGWKDVLDDDGEPIIKTDSTDGRYTLYHYMVDGNVSVTPK